MSSPRKKASPGAANGAALSEALKANGYDPPGPGEPPRPGESLLDPERYPLLFALRPRTISMLRMSLRSVPIEKRPIDPTSMRQREEGWPVVDRPKEPGEQVVCAADLEPLTDDKIIGKVGFVYRSIVLEMTALADDRAEPHPDVPPATRAFLEEKLSAIFERLERAERDPAASALRNEHSPITRELSAAAFDVRELLRWNQRTGRDEPLAEYRSAAFYASELNKTLGLPINAGVRLCWHADLARRGENIARAERDLKTEFKKWQKACARIRSSKTG